MENQCFQGIFRNPNPFSMKKSFIAFVLLWYWIASQTPVHGQKVDLSLNLKNGHRYVQEMTATSTIRQQIQGQDLDFGLEISGTIAFSVKETHPDGYLMDVQYDRLFMSMKIPMAGELRFDSEDTDPENVFSNVVKNMVGKPFVIKMSKSGKVLEVKNIEGLFDAAFKDFPEISDQQRDQILSQLNQAYGADAFKGSLEMLTSIFPEKPVAVGDKWDIQTKLRSGIDAAVNTEFTLEQHTKDYNLITGKAVFKTEPNGPSVKSGSQNLNMELEGTMVSSIKVDPRSGWVISADISQNYQGNAKFESSDQMPEGLLIPMNFTTKMEVKGK